MGDLHGPLGLFLLGLAVVVFDVRINGFDVLLDAGGYVVVLVGIVRLRREVVHGASGTVGLARVPVLLALVVGLPGNVADVRPPPGFAIMTDPLTLLNRASEALAMVGYLLLLVGLQRHFSAIAAVVLERHARTAGNLTLAALLLLPVGWVGAVTWGVGTATLLLSLLIAALGFVAFLATVYVAWKARSLPPWPPSPTTGTRPPATSA